MKKKILIIGYGSISRKLVKLLNKNNNLEIAVLRTKLKIKENKKINFFFELRHAINFKPQYVFICCPVNLHSYYFEKFKNLKNNIFIEKPLLFRENEIEKFKKYKANVQVGYFLRFHPAIIYLKKYIKKNLSKLRMINLEVGFDVRKWRPKRNLNKTVTVNSRMGGGALLELSHELDLVTWFIGYPNQIYCDNERISKLNLNVEDISRIILFYKKKKILANLNLDLIQNKYSRNIKITFDEMVVKYDFVKNNIYFYKNNSTKKKSFNSNLDRAYKNQIDFFINRFSRNKKKYPLEYSNHISCTKLSKLLFKLKQSNKMKKRINFN